MKAHIHPIYPIERSDTKPSQLGAVTQYFLSPEEHEHYKQLPVPQKTPNLDTTAPQRRRRVPGATGTYSYEKKGGEGA